MALLLLLATLTACAAKPEDLSGKMFNFPEETKDSHVRLIPPKQDFSAITVCLRFFPHLHKDYSLFSMASSSTSNDFLIYRKASSDEISVMIKNHKVIFGKQDVQLNMWHSVCSTWDSESELVELWFDGEASNSTSVRLESIDDPIIIVLGQVHDSLGTGFDLSFVGNMSDVHMWDFELTLCEIQDYMNHLDFPPGNVLDWSGLEFEKYGEVLLQSKN